jgi:D-sedoheptulose 7-phosphate isomerase
MLNTDASVVAATILRKRLDENVQALTRANEAVPAFIKAVSLVQACIIEGGTILSCGNGGNGSTASHIMNDFIGHLYIKRRPMRAISLVDNLSVMTGLTNDMGYEVVFSRQVEAFGTPGDILIALSTSGSSPNVLLAAKTAKEKGMSVIALTNRSGGQLAELADVWLYADSLDPVCSENVHVVLLHSLCESVEALLFKDQPGWAVPKAQF